MQNKMPKNARKTRDFEVVIAGWNFEVHDLR